MAVTQVTETQIHEDSTLEQEGRRDALERAYFCLRTGGNAMTPEDLIAAADTIYNYLKDGTTP